MFLGLAGLGFSGVEYPDACQLLGRKPSNGTLTNFAWPNTAASGWNWVPELGRWGVACDGNNDEITFGDVLNLAGVVSLACWVYPRALTGDQKYFGRTVSSFTAPYIQYSLGLNNGGLRLDYWDGAANRFIAQSAVTLTQDKWNHICGVITPGSQRLYVNGTLSNSATNANAVAASTASTMQFRMGRYLNTLNYVNAIVGDVVVAQDAWSVSQIQQLADPSNTMLAGLLLPPRRRVFAVGGGAPPAPTGNPWYAYAQMGV